MSWEGGTRTFLRPQLRGGDFLLVAAVGVGGGLLVLLLRYRLVVGFCDVRLRAAAEGSDVTYHRPYLQHLAETAGHLCLLSGGGSRVRRPGRVRWSCCLVYNMWASTPRP